MTLSVAVSCPHSIPLPPPHTHCHSLIAAPPLGCFGFGHSWGGSIALTMEVRQPGTFAALYVYEPVVCNEMIRQALLMR